MGWRFRKSFKILPGVRVNVGKKGISSVSVGKRGASVSVGKRGTHANVGIPGTGLSYRTKIGGKRQSQVDSPVQQKTNPIYWVLLFFFVVALISMLF